MSLRISDLQGRRRVVGMHTQHRVPANDVARRCEAGTEAIRIQAYRAELAQTSAPGWAIAADSPGGN